jgi:hypothetical protein
MAPAGHDQHSHAPMVEDSPNSATAAPCKLRARVVAPGADGAAPADPGSAVGHLERRHVARLAAELHPDQVDRFPERERAIRPLR